MLQCSVISELKNLRLNLRCISFILILQLNLQPFRHFTYVTAHSPTLPSLYLRHSSFSDHSVASPTSQFILQPFFRFSYVTSSSLNTRSLPFLIVRAIKCASVFCHFRTQKLTVKFTLYLFHIDSSAQSPTFPSLHLRQNSFPDPSVALPTSQLILQPFRPFTYVTAHSPTLPLLHMRHSSFSNTSFAYVTSSSLNSPGEPSMINRYYV